MDIRDPKLLEAVLALPNTFNEYKKVATERFEKIEQKLDDAVYIHCKLFFTYVRFSLHLLF